MRQRRPLPRSPLPIIAAVVVAIVAVVGLVLTIVSTNGT
jgi:hypothetical protein